MQLQSGYRERTIEVLSTFLAGSMIRKEIVILEGRFRSGHKFSKKLVSC